MRAGASATESHSGGETVAMIGPRLHAETRVMPRILSIQGFIKACGHLAPQLKTSGAAVSISLAGSESLRHVGAPCGAMMLACAREHDDRKPRRQFPNDCAIPIITASRIHNLGHFPL